MPVILFTLLFSAFTFADLNKISIDDLNFHYSEPFGEGTLQKINLGFSLVPGPYQVQVTKTPTSLDLTSDFIDINWNNPWSFVHDLEELSVKNTSLALGGKKHFIKSENLLVRPDKRGDYKAKDLSLNCEGSATGEFLDRLLDDCHASMNLVVERVDVPTDFILYKLLEGLPLPPAEMDFPADDLKLNVKEGDFSLVFYIKYYVYAGLRAWGNFHYENDHKTIVIKINRIKFGYFTVTNLVMRRLKEIVTSPRVKVEPPYIRIDLSEMK